MMTQHWVKRMIHSKASNKMIGMNFHLVRDLLTASVVARSLLLKLCVYKHKKLMMMWGFMSLDVGDKKFKRMLLIRTRHSLQISGGIPFVKLQNDTETKVKNNEK